MGLPGRGSLEKGEISQGAVCETLLEYFADYLGSPLPFGVAPKRPGQIK